MFEISCIGTKHAPRDTYTYDIAIHFRALSRVSCRSNLIFAHFNPWEFNQCIKIGQMLSIFFQFSTLNSFGRMFAAETFWHASLGHMHAVVLGHSLAWAREVAVQHYDMR